MSLIKGFNIFIILFLLLIIYATFIVKNYTEEVLLMLTQVKKQHVEEKHKTMIVKAEASLVFATENIQKITNNLLASKPIEAIDLSKIVNKVSLPQGESSSFVKNKINWRYKDPIGDMRKVSFKK